MASQNTNQPNKPSIEIAIERNLTEIELIDTLLEQRLSGDPNAYRDLLTDTTVSGTWTQRQTALTRLERQVIPHDPDNPTDIEAAEFIDAQLNRINFDKVLKAMHWGVFYGIAVGEAMFGIEDGKVVINDVLVRDRAKFKFNVKRELVFTGNDSETVMPPRKFWVYAAGGDTTDNPYGIGLAHFLYWPVLFKKSNVKFWLLGNEKMATSTPHVQYDPSAKDPDTERRKALQAGIGIKNGSAIATAKGTLVELLKGASGTTDYHTLCKYMDEAIALVTLGQVMTSQAVGGQYKAEVQNEVKDDIIKADADLLCASLNNSIVRWLTEWNFPTAKPPKVWLLTQDEIDQQAVSTTFANMGKLGYRPTIEHVTDTLGGEWEAIPSPALVDQSHTSLEEAQDDLKDFAEEEEPTTVNLERIDDIIDQAEAELADHQTDWLDAIRDQLDQAESLEAFRDQLDTLIDTLSFDQYAALFADASIAAKLAGMASVTAEEGA